MPLSFFRNLSLVFLSFGIAAAQEPAAASGDATIQSLLKEVHALRIALEQSNRVGPRIQIALARMQVQEERVRNASRDLQQTRNQILTTQTQRTELADHLKQLDAGQSQVIDPGERKQLESRILEVKSHIEQLNSMEQQYRAKESEQNSVVLTEQSKWDEANDVLRSIERALAQTIQ